MRRAASILSALCAFFASLVSSVHAQSAPTHDDAPDPRERVEVAGFPLVAGNTDIGVELGGVVTISRFSDDFTPYLWNLDVLLSASLKSEQGSLHFVQQSHVLRLDQPHLLGGRLRIDTRASFQRLVDDGYYGLGNGAKLVPETSGTFGLTRDRYLYEETRVRSIARIHTHSAFDIALTGAFRYMQPDVYANSKLAHDLALDRTSSDPTLLGAHPTPLLKLGGGFMYDTRDNELITRQGLFYQVGLAGTFGTSSENIRYGELAVVLAHYAPLHGALTVAARAFASFQFGRVPFYDLAQGGVYEPLNLFGGESGIRGVPLGRYAGEIKTLANFELRSTGRRFKLIGQSVRFGTTTFFDIGRLWGHYAADPVQDGHGLGLKFGVGGGGFVQWGQAAIFRIEVAYSPDAAATNASFPFGIYASDGLMF